MTVVLHGLKYSVYTRIVKMALLEKGVAFDQVEVNPFADDMPLSYLDLHPFRRVPTLVLGDVVLYETTAITRYIDESFDGPSLQPEDPLARARMTQIISIIDNYAYIPMVRQVFSHIVLWPHLGRESDPEQVSLGLTGARLALKALENIASEGHQLNSKSRSLADLHLAAMMTYFVAADEGAEMLQEFPVLADWWQKMRLCQSLAATDPGQFPQG
ncbi:MAG: glutathione S-transferase family protein [Sneathiella sp.]|nr:glutathione S-transferase family protein [Sneathiella sp.]